jgi:galactokinase
VSRSDVRSHFTRAFGSAPAVVASAPGRVNLIGEHTDYNGGVVLPIAVDLRTSVAVSTRVGARVTRLVSGGTGGIVSIDHARLERAGRWTDYVAGVLDEFARLGFDVPGLDIAIESDVPSGGGLSSSAALEVATAFGIASVLGATMDLRELALSCQRAERDFVGVPCGAMDQLASALGREGHALHVDCATLDVHHVPFVETVMVFDTAVPRSLRRSAYADRVRECALALSALREADPGLEALGRATLEAVARAPMDDVVRRRARHVVTECARVREACAILEPGAPFPGQLALASHHSLREDYDASCAELDWVVERATRSDGVRGARLTGAGWGGCAVIFGEPWALETLGDGLAADYQAAFGRKSRSWLLSAAEGVRAE